MAGRVISSGGEPSGRGSGSKKGLSKRGAHRAVGTSERHTTPRSVSSGFVDARAMDSADVVERTLAEGEGTLGLLTRPKVIDFSARAKERKRANMRVRLLRALAGLAAIGVLVAVAWLLFFSPVLRLETPSIRISGANAWVSEEQVKDIVAAQSGKSLLLVDTTAMSETLADIPGVTKAKVSRAFPHGIKVAIVAQRPAAMLSAEGDQLTAVDRQGRVLNSVSDAPTAGVPVIEVKDVDKALGSRAIKEALKVLDAMSEDMRKSVTKVTAETQDSVITELNGGERTIVWGDSSDLKLKKAIVDKILADPNVIGDKHQIDVSAPGRPVLR